MQGKRVRKQNSLWKRLLCLGLLLCVVAALSSESPAAAVPVRPETGNVPEQEPVPAQEMEPAAIQPGEEEPAQPTTMVVPQGEPVEEDYFRDAVFLGDSRTEGLYLYGGMEEGNFLYAVGATVESVFTKATQTTEQGEVPMLDALAELSCGKVYVMLGVNELGWPQAEKFKEQYGKLIDRVREDHPETEVVIQSILPVSAKQEAKKTYVNNDRIQTYNAMLEELALEKGCPYLNVAEAVTGEDGCLTAELTSDGVHLNIKGCKLWVEYLKTHPAA